MLFVTNLRSYATLCLPVALLIALFSFGPIFKASGFDAVDEPAAILTEESQMAELQRSEFQANEFQRNVSQANEFQIVVTPRNFNEFFTLTGRVNVGTGTWTPTFNANTRVITLTEQDTERAGFATLNRKISPEQDFYFEGAVNLGANSKPNIGSTASGPAIGNIQGGDGMGFFFHTYEPGTVGTSGSGMGIGGLSNAFGFKLDTFSNRNIHHSNFSRTDRIFPDNTSFASFIYTAWFSDSGVSNYFVHNHPQFDGVGGTAAMQAQESFAEWIGALPPERANEAPRTIFHPNNNNFRDIRVSYNGSSNVMRINYNDRGFHLANTNPLHHQNWQTWEKDVSVWMAEDYLSFGFSAATGGAVNRHQVRFDEFRFTPMSNLRVRYIDEVTGNSLIPDITYSHTAGTRIQLSSRVAEMLALGYDFTGASSTEPSRFDTNNHSLVLSVEEDRTVTFHFRAAERPVTLSFETEVGQVVHFKEAEAIVARQDESLTATLLSTFTPAPNLLTIPGHELVAWYVAGQHNTPILISSDPNPRIQNVQDTNRLVLIYREKLKELNIRKVLEDDPGNPGGDFSGNFSDAFDFDIVVSDINNEPRAKTQIPFTHSNGTTGSIKLDADGAAQGAFSLKDGEYINLQLGYFSHLSISQSTEGHFITRIEDKEENLLAEGNTVHHYMAGTNSTLIFISQIQFAIVPTDLSVEIGKEAIASLVFAVLATMTVLNTKMATRRKVGCRKSIKEDPVEET